MSTTEPIPNHPFNKEIPNPARLRADIVHSVLTEGVKSRALLGKSPHMSSADHGIAVLGRPDLIEGCNLKPPTRFTNTDTFSAALVKELYEGPFSIFPVLNERSDQDDSAIWRGEDESVRIIPRRLESSVLLVCSNEHSGGVIKYRQIPPDKFLYILIPQQIWKEYIGAYPSQLTRTEIVVVYKSILRKISGHEVEVPDYEGVLKDILEKRSEPVFIHAVRLPTDEDV